MHNAEAAPIDPDKRLAALFAPAEARCRLLALYAWHHEITRAGAASEPLMGAMRLAWHREAVEDVYATPSVVRRHPAVEGLAKLAAGPGAPDRDALLALIDAQLAELEPEGFTAPEDLAAQADAMAGGLMRIAAKLAAPDAVLDAAGEAALAAAGRAWGLAGLARAFPRLAGRGRAPVAASTLAGLDLTPARLASGREPVAARTALEPLLGAARAAVAGMKARSRDLPAAVFPACGYAALAGGYVRRLAAVRDPYREAVEAPLVQRQMRLLAASLTGRF